jgi:dihydroxyacetone kinase-like protein
MDEAKLSSVARSVAALICVHAEEPTVLDPAIGDGDHGVDLKRGAEAVLAEMPKLVGRPVGDVLRAAGMQIVMKVGGAFGPLMGTWEMGKQLPPLPACADVMTAMGAAVLAVKARGKSEEGKKSMLDVHAARHSGERSRRSRRSPRWRRKRPFQSRRGVAALSFSAIARLAIWTKARGRQV